MTVLRWDFTEAVKFWLDGKHENHGFMMHSTAGYMDNGPVYSHRADNPKTRPAMMVVYEPKP